MSSTSSSNSQSNVPNFKPHFFGIAALVAAIVCIGLYLTAIWSESERQRDIQTWQEKLNLIAESRTSDISSWVNTHFKELRDLADNPSLKLYLSTLQMMSSTSSDNTTAEPAQKSYLRNLLLFTAERGGFSIPPGTSAKPIPATLPSDNKGVLAIINAKGETVVSTGTSQEMQTRLEEFSSRPPVLEDTLLDFWTDKEGTPFVGFITPIFSIQGERDAKSRVGSIIGIIVVNNAFFARLHHPGIIEKTLETILLRADGNQLDYLSPLQDGSGPMARHITRDADKSAEAKLLLNVGASASTLNDYRGKTVLATSRAIPGTSWVLMTKIDAQEALKASDQRRTSMKIFLLLLLTCVVLLIITIWWRARDARSLLLSHYFRDMAEKSLAQEALLRLVTDNQPEPIYIVDAANTYCFANKKAADVAHMLPEHVPGKTLANIRGTAVAEHISEMSESALDQRQTLFDVARHEQVSGEIITRSAYIPLEHIPVASLPNPTPGVLIVEQDMTAVIHERERRIATQEQLVQTLVKLVDRRDPFSANHSLLVSKLAFTIATDIELAATLVDTARLAGTLMNIGKIIIPTDILTKTERLSDTEMQTIRDSVNVAANLLKDIGFDGPVAETLRQSSEKWDGTGPLSLRGEAILITARIIAVSNAFVGMVSPRAWRDAINTEKAGKLLLEQADIAYDRRIVIALINYIENHQGKEWLASVIRD